MEKELLTFIFALCLKKNIPACDIRYYDCVQRMSQNRNVEDPKKFCRNVLKDFILDK